LTFNKIDKMNFRLSAIMLVFVLLNFTSCDNSPKQKEEKIYSEDVEIDDLSRLIAKSPNDTGLLMQRAKAYTSKEAYNSAISDLKHLIQIDSLDANAYNLLSDCYMDSYQSRLSLETMEEAAQRFPSNIHTQLKLSETQYILNKNDLSIMTINKILANDPQNAEAYFMLGLNFRAMGDLTRAKNAFQTATEFDSDLVDAWIILGDIYGSEGNPKAKEYYESAMRISNNATNVLHSYAFYLQNNGEVDKALDLYKKINLIDREYGDAYLNAGVLYIEKDSLDKAFEQFNLLCQIDPANYYGYMYRGIVLKLEGRVEEGNKDIESCLNLTNQNEEVKDQIIKIEEMLGIDKKYQ